MLSDLSEYCLNFSIIDLVDRARIIGASGYRDGETDEKFDFDR